MNKLLFFLFLSSSLQAQQLPDSVTSKIDSIFGMYTSSTPGCAVAVQQNGSIVFQKGYGLANMEYGIPIRPTTIFHIASESKQYVAFCILLLEKEGKLKLEDDIRTYLDYVPAFGKKISIRQLILHTSGLRDQWQLLANAGWQLDDVITQEHVIKLVSRQNALNFNPGDEYMYCNTGYTLLAEIIKKLSGKSLRQFAEERIFSPLGMKDTHFHDNYQELVPGRAYSYNSAAGGKYQHAVLSYSIVGATSLFTTVLDETKWLNNLETGKVGGKELVDKMKITGALNDGRQLNYAMGQVIGKFKGWEQIGHGGADAGYRTYAVRYPEKQLGIVVFSNLGFANPGRLANLIAEVLITDTKPDTVKSPVYKADTVLFKKLKGKYYTERGDLAELSFYKGGLFVRMGNAGMPVELKLSEEAMHRYKLSSGGTMVLNPKELTGDSIVTFEIINPINKQFFKRQPLKPVPVTAEYEGRFYSDELEAFYSVQFKNGKLELQHRKFETVPLTNIAPDQFTSPFWWMSHIRFIRDKNKRVIAFEVNAGRVQGLEYRKVNK